MNCPKAPIPEPLRGIETGTFTHSSIVERLPDTGRRILAENDFSPAENDISLAENDISPAVTNELLALFAGIPDEKIQPLAGGPPASGVIQTGIDPVIGIGDGRSG